MSYEDSESPLPSPFTLWVSHMNTAFLSHRLQQLKTDNVCEMNMIINIPMVHLDNLIIILLGPYDFNTFYT